MTRSLSLPEALRESVILKKKIIKLKLLTKLLINNLGRATAIRFSKENAKVVVADMNEIKGHETVKIINDAGKKGIFGIIIKKFNNLLVF